MGSQNRSCLIVGTALLAACSDRAAVHDYQPEARQPTAPVELRFAWPESGMVRVTERAERREGTLEFRYDLILELAADERVVRPANITLVESGSDEALRRMPLGSSTAFLASALPALRVSRDGSYLGIADYEAWHAQAASAIESIATKAKDRASKKRWEASLAAFGSDANRHQVEADAGDRWETWVGAWRGLTIVPGSSGRCSTRVFLPWAGFYAPVELPYSFPGFVREPSDCVRIEVDGEVTHADTATGLSAVFTTLVLADATKMRVRMERMAVLEPGTLRPLHAHSVRTFLNEASSGTRQVREARTWTFAWGAGH